MVEVLDGAKLSMEDLGLYSLDNQKKEKNWRISCFGMLEMELEEEVGQEERMLNSMQNILWIRTIILSLQSQMKLHNKILKRSSTDYEINIFVYHNFYLLNGKKI